jgi:two-component system cell cycle sensor histidine kinase/response regulator CckA
VNVLGDRGQLSQIVLNLVTNADEAIDDVGTVRITVTTKEASEVDLTTYVISTEPRPGPFALIEVQDDGAGMTVEQRQRIFDPFFTTKFEGRGLGLAAVFGSVHAHGGALSVRSEEGHGTTMQVLLPLSEGDVYVPVAEPPRKPAREAHGTILVVDDEELLIRLCRRVLEREGWTVVTASDGEEALRQSRAHPELVLVLLDFTMPKLDGHEVIRELRRIDPALPIVLMSGQGPLKDQGVEPNAFLAKPFFPKDLVSLAMQFARDR